LTVSRVRGAMPARGMRSGAAGRSEADANGSVRRLDISLDRFRRKEAICESRMPLVVRGLWGPPRSVGMRGRGGAGECGQVPRILRALLAF